MATRHAVLVSTDPQWALELARAWAAAGDEVTLVLLDAAAALARPAHPLGDRVASAAGAGVTLLVHDGALRRRGLDRAAVRGDLKVVTLDEVADLVADGADRAVWL
jgi:hypothetical protein